MFFGGGDFLYLVAMAKNPAKKAIKKNKILIILATIGDLSNILFCNEKLKDNEPKIIPTINPEINFHFNILIPPQKRKNISFFILFKSNLLYQCKKKKATL